MVVSSLYLKFTYALPSGVHSWAQADRYSLACRYLEGGQFSEPKTYNLMSVDGKVGVEFPILPFISARVSRLSSPEFLPWIMRGLNAVLLFLGLFLLAKNLDGDVMQRSAMVAMVFLSPVLVFYSFNFLPDSTGLAIVLLAIAQLLRYLKSQRNKNWILALLLAAFATLVKTTCGIYFIALGASLFLKFIREKKYKSVVYLVVVQAITALLIVLYDVVYFYQVNVDLWSIIFMSESQPIENWKDLQLVVKGFGYWFGQWASWYQILTLAIVGVLLRMDNRRVVIDKTLLHFFIISVIGVILFISQMGKQYVNHDYYFVASVIPLIFLFAVVLNQQMAQSSKKIYMVILALGFVLSGIHSFEHYVKRSSSHFTWKNRTILNDTKWMNNGDDRLLALGVEKDAKVFVLYEFAPNTPLVYLNRKGRVFNHEEMTREKQNMDYWVDRIKPRYFIVQKKWNDHIKRDQADLAKSLRLLATDDELMVYEQQKDLPN